MLRKNGNIIAVICLIIFAGSLNSQNKISFIAIGDWGKRGEYNQKDVAIQMGYWAASNKADFVISLGDNFYENGVSSTNDSQWQLSYENIYNSQSLQIPWYASLGNHDYNGNVQAQIDYSDISPRWKMPSRYYSFIKKIDDSTTALFVILDTNPICESDDEYKKDPNGEILKIDNKVQIRWLDSTLANTPAKWKFVCGHHTIISGGYHGGVREMQELIDPVLIKNNVDVYFCGHDHDMEHLKKGKINYFVSGGGSLTRTCDDTKFTKFYASDLAGFLGVNLSKNELTAAFTDFMGNVVYTTSIKKKY